MNSKKIVILVCSAGGLVMLALIITIILLSGDVPEPDTSDMEVVRPDVADEHNA